MMRPASLLLFACIAGGGVLVFLDRMGDRAAYAAAEEFLKDNPQVRDVFGPNPEMRRTGGAVLGGQVLNWSGKLTGNGVDAVVRVGMNRPTPDDAWRPTRARYRIANGEWRSLHAREGEPPSPAAAVDTKSIVEEQAWRYLRAAQRPHAPTAQNPIPALDHPIHGVVVNLSREVGLNTALVYADSAGALLGNDLLRTYALAVAYKAVDSASVGAELIRRWLERNGDDSQGWTALARLYHDAGAYSSAINATYRATAANPSNGEALVSRGLTYFKAGDRSRSLEAYARACELHSVLGCEMERSLRNSRE
jgi:tetratricopeptide (TPR) repeat protein